TSLMVRLKMMREQSPTPEFAGQVSDLRQLVGQTLADVHNLSVELRPSALDDLGLAAALERYVQDCHCRYELDVDLVAVGLGKERLPASVETAFYRIIQEGLTNIARHANATCVSILIERRDGRVRAIIEDDGDGFDVSHSLQAGRLGLHGMRERAELLNGTLVIESNPGQGSSIFVEAPV
ncbi:MAG: sensor histidine kinase, partial [Anaerolineae bacterium]